MLYDTRWEKTETRADSFTLESLIAWLEKQPANGRYNYVDPNNCMLCQYFGAMGFEAPSITTNILRHAGGSVKFSTVFSGDIAIGSANDYDMTFGTALQRARALVS